MIDQNKLMNRIKMKTEVDRATISSMIYFVKETAVFAVKDLVTGQSGLQMAWLDGEALTMKQLADLPAGVSITKVLKKEDKDAMLFVLSDNSLVVISASEPALRPPQVIRQRP
jgi:hypothetical protein